MRAIPKVSTHQFGVFTTRQALDAGWSTSALHRAVHADNLIRPRIGVYALPPEGDLDEYEVRSLLLGQRGVAAALQIPTASVSHAASLAVHGLPTFRASEIPCITNPQDCRTHQVDLHLHRKKLSPKLLSPSHDFSVTSVARSVVDTTCELGLAAGVIAGDAALREKRTTWDELLVARRSIRGDLGSPMAGRMLELVDPRSESPLESLSRVNMLDLVPPPLIQPWIFTRDGVLIGRVDFLWEEMGVIGEADGAMKYRDPSALRDEKKRQEALTNTNAVMARWDWSVALRPRQLSDYILGRLEMGWQRRAAGIHPQWIVKPSDPWAL